MRSHLSIAAGLLVPGLLASCGAPPDDRPVAAIAVVTLDQEQLPFGSPLEMRYTFERTVDAPPLEGPYRVFVHFTDPDGVLLWGDDHDPPVPVEAWEAGRPVTWTREFFLPRVAYAGPVELRAGLFSPETGARLRLGAEPAGADAYRLATFEVTAQRYPLDFLEGWHPAEQAGGARPEEWRWSTGEGRLEFLNPARDVTLHLTLDRTVELPEPQTVTLRLGETIIDVFTLPAGERVWRRVPIDGEAFGEALVQTITVTADQTFVPAEMGSGPDQRELGVRVFDAVVLPR